MFLIKRFFVKRKILKILRKKCLPYRVILEKLYPRGGFDFFFPKKGLPENHFLIMAGGVTTGGSGGYGITKN